MTITLYAQPYDLAATGFYFGDYDTYKEKVAKLLNDYGDPVEEFEIQFIDGKAVDYEFSKAWGINQANIKSYFDAVNDWEDWQKIPFIIAVGECGYSFDPETVCPDDFEVDIYDVASMRELAEQFVDEGLFGEIPEHLEFYIDYDAIARDLAMDYSETTLAGERYIYRCS